MLIDRNRSPQKEAEVSTESGQTMVVSRILRAQAARIYKAFIDSAAMVKWMQPHGFTGRGI